MEPRKMNFEIRHAALLLGSLAAFVTPFACETGAATYAVIDDAYPAPADDAGAGPRNVVYRGWWTVTYFATPVTAGGESAANRVIPATDYAYVVLAPGWDPASGSPPATLLPMRTTDKVSVARGDTLHITISDATAIGNCAAGQPLTQDEADLVTRSIFPAEFAGVTYDARTCTSTPIADGGSVTVDASSDAALDGGSVDSGPSEGNDSGAGPEGGVVEAGAPDVGIEARSSASRPRLARYSRATFARGAPELNGTQSARTWALAPSRE